MQHILRTWLSLPLAGLITVGLGSLMAYLVFVEADEFRPSEELNIELFDIVDPVTPEIIDRFEAIEAVTPPPPPVQLTVEPSNLPDPDYGIISGSIPALEPASLISNAPNFNVADSAGTPWVRIEPVYPARDADRGIEGACTVFFDLDTQGLPVNVRSGECPSASIARASVRAVERWRYQPRVVNGEAVARTNVSVVLEFNLE